jgi:hypothetical protein
VSPPRYLIAFFRHHHEIIKKKKMGIGKDLGHQLACKNGKGEGRILVPISNI